MDFTIRPVRESDAAEWIRMRREVFGDSEDHDAEVRAYFAGSAAAPTFVAERPSGALVGFIELSVRSYAEGCVTGPVGYIEGWYVDPDARRMGLGRVLVQTAETWARNAGYREMGSDALLGNDLSVKAHAALGYREVCRIVCFRRVLDDI
jgi:aminoglycoside 6'-N-acetyltransferase I